MGRMKASLNPELMNLEPTARHQRRADNLKDKIIAEVRVRCMRKLLMPVFKEPKLRAPVQWMFGDDLSYTR